jgi:hypothetical protein
MTMGFKGWRFREIFEAFFPTPGCEMKLSFRASGARPGIQDLLKILDSGACPGLRSRVCRNDAVSCSKLIRGNPSFQQAATWWWREAYRERFARR